MVVLSKSVVLRARLHNAFLYEEIGQVIGVSKHNVIFRLVDLYIKLGADCMDR